MLPLHQKLATSTIILHKNFFELTSRPFLSKFINFPTLCLTKTSQISLLLSLSLSHRCLFPQPNKSRTSFFPTFFFLRQFFSSPQRLCCCVYTRENVARGLSGIDSKRRERLEGGNFPAFLFTTTTTHTHPLHSLLPHTMQERGRETFLRRNFPSRLDSRHCCCLFGCVCNHSEDRIGFSS